MTRPGLRLVRSSGSGSSSPDAEALARVSRGDLGGLGELYDRYAPAVHAFARRAAPGDDAEDIVQNVFLRLLATAQSFDARAPSARAWIFGVTANVMRERRRSLARLGRVLGELLVEPREPTPAPGAAGVDLERALSRLSEPKRVVLLLAEVEGFACPEIAAMLGIPVGTVWTRLHHARRQLRRYYDQSEAT